ncbi:MAG: hypothetical protein IKO99_04435 [Bacteroidales bacterium]|nr:hypothetical protein [Bacteroidales bacterium]
MKNKLEYHIPLIITAVMALAIKIPCFFMPMCYSEAQLYTDKVFALKNSGLTTVFASDGSVQLPDLFSVLTAFFSRFVSTENAFLHAFSLVFAALSVITAYKFGKFFFSVYGGVISAALMTVQNVFLAQTGLVLPQMALNFFILCALYCYFREKFAWCSVLLTLAALTDILGILTSVFVLTAYYKEKSNREWKLSTNIALCLPVVIWFAYQFLSVNICGTLSIRGFDFDVKNLLNILNFTFIEQFRFVLSAVFLTAALITKFSKNTDFYAGDVFKTSGIYFGFILVSGSLFKAEESFNILFVSILAIMTGCAVPLLNIHFRYKYLITCGLIIVFAVDTFIEEKYTDSYLSYKDKVEVDKKAVTVLTDKLQGGETILCDKYFKMFLEHSALGYMTHSFELLQNHKITVEMPDSGGKLLTIKTNFMTAPEFNNEDFKNICKIKKSGYEVNIFKK